MNIILRRTVYSNQAKGNQFTVNFHMSKFCCFICDLYRFSVAARTFCCSTVASTKEWRVSKGLSINKNAEGILTDGPDYTFLDGRPTPLLVIQADTLTSALMIFINFATCTIRIEYVIIIMSDKHKNDLVSKQTLWEHYVELHPRPETTYYYYLTY